jgi:hypothetical protein
MCLITLLVIKMENSRFKLNLSGIGSDSIEEPAKLSRTGANRYFKFNSDKPDDSGSEGSGS